MRIYLVGFMGSGKTTFGRKLAQKLGYAFADLDERLAAHTGKTIPELFANLGEAGFRKLEQEVLHQTMADADVGINRWRNALFFRQYGLDEYAWKNRVYAFRCQSLGQPFGACQIAQTTAGRKKRG